MTLPLSRGESACHAHTVDPCGMQNLAARAPDNTMMHSGPLPTDTLLTEYHRPSIDRPLLTMYSTLYLANTGDNNFIDRYFR